MENIAEQSGITGRVRIITYKAGTREILRVAPWSKNLVVNNSNRGRNIIAQRLASTNTYTLNITHGEIGTGTNVPANSDTALQTPTARVATTLATISIALNVVSCQFFFGDAALANGTYREFGTFIDGTATIGTGQLFNRALFATAYTKASGEDTTIEVEFTIN